MSATKDLYMDECQRIYDTLVEAGCPDDLAYEIASERAYPAMQEKLRDMADGAKDRAKEGR